jgi:membrane fusion protein, multidrug efflux system
VPIQIRAVGIVEPIQQVAVRSPVAGYITGVFFKEGEDIRIGQRLFQIDPRPYDAAYRQVRGNLERDRALSENADRQLQRYEELHKNNLISQQEYDQARTTADSLRAAVRSGEAAMQKAGLDLQFSTIRAPITGRAGALQTNLGNLVKVNDSTLVAINQIVPIDVRFSVPEKHLDAIRSSMAQRELAVSVINKAKDPEGPAGKLVFINNAVDRATGAILLKAAFDNADRRLWPGQYVDVLLVLDTRKGAVVVPSQAVLAGQQGNYVYVLEKEDTAKIRIVAAGESVDGLTVIENGISAGERVVTDGQLRIVPGGKVQIREQGGAGHEGKADGERK